MVSSYTPTLGALLKARRSRSPSRLVDVHTLLVAEAAAPGLRRLPYVLKEVSVVAGALGAASKTETVGIGGAAMQTVLDHLPRASILHLACHGAQNTANVLESGFFLRDGKLTVAKLMKLDLPKAFFAYLSACETAKGDSKQPDQAVHLAAAMLFVGFRSVIGTMWSVIDEAQGICALMTLLLHRTVEDALGPLVAGAVYNGIIEGDAIDAEAIPYALDAAVRRLRQQGHSANRWAPFIHIGA